ncbi:MAG: hypothetical protein J6V07_00475 [Clostridia bacterium]|nr:hypothetical protein [Clostridia bacterium]
MYSETDAVVIPLALAVMLVIALSLALLLRRREGWVRAIPTAIVALLVVLLEVEKQRQNLLGQFYEGGYSRYGMPLHYCSLFSLFFPLAELGGRRLRRVFQPVAVATSLTVSVAILVAPQGILGGTTATYLDDFHSFHGVTYHMLVILYLLLTVALGRYRPSRGDRALVAAAIAGYVALAIPHAYGLGVNYCNYLFSVIPPVEELRLAVGQVPYAIGQSIVLIGGTTFASWLYATGFRLVTKKGKREK